MFEYRKLLNEISDLALNDALYAACCLLSRDLITPLEYETIELAIRCARLAKRRQHRISFVFRLVFGFVLGVVVSYVSKMILS